MSEDLFLFGEGYPPAPVELPMQPSLVSDWQVDLLRKALDGRGLTSMADRQRAVEDAVGRPVQSLRALTHDEAMSALTELGRGPASERRVTSSWDERDEDTWIDRL
ncbi:hypothetical protein INN71_08640 [Nocardioides sp. ChNu-153]|uniref:hypothetical protein n=1 Tax=Nocardioides sp. ChNu-153 TaxID=2779364 RepID=UPI002656F2BE|nr:hypothetical protein [Nocardioides sp. ChNu-153]MDN7121456.1 hypothetical protein [Nocardioides sp. ChNu-153]